MQECRRGPAPELLARYGPEIGAEYARRRREDPKYRFQWPQRGGQKLYEVARVALAEMTAHRCSYCDGYPLDATSSTELVPALRAWPRSRRSGAANPMPSWPTFRTAS